MSSFTLPEACKVVGILKPATDAAGRTSRYVSLKNAHKAWIIVYVEQANAATIALSVLQATAVAGTGSKAITKTVPIWSNQDVAGGDTQTRETDAVSFTTSVALKEKQVIFQIDPATLDQANGFDCIGISTGASNVANLTSAVVVVESRYPAANPATTATD